MKTRTTHRSCRGRVARGHFRGIGRPAGKWENGRAAGEHEDGAAVERHAHPDERATEKGLGRPLHRQAESKNAIGIQRDRRRCSSQHHRDRAGDGEGSRRRSGAQALQVRDGAGEAGDRESERRQDRGRHYPIILRRHGRARRFENGIA